MEHVPKRTRERQADLNLEDSVRTESMSDMGYRPGGAYDLRNSDDTHTLPPTPGRGLERPGSPPRRGGGRSQASGSRANLQRASGPKAQHSTLTGPAGCKGAMTRQDRLGILASEEGGRAIPLNPWCRGRSYAPGGRDRPSRSGNSKNAGHPRAEAPRRRPGRGMRCAE